MYNEKLHFYRCTDPKNAPPYAFYDYSNGLVGYPHKLAEPVAKFSGAYYLGFMTEKEVLNRPKVGRRPVKAAPIEKPKMRKERTRDIYNFYENGKLIASGTATEISKATEFKKNTIVKFGTPKYVQGIDKKVNRYAEKVGKK